VGSTRRRRKDAAARQQLQLHGLLSQQVCIGQQRQALIEQGTMLSLGLRQSDLTAPELDVCSVCLW